MSVDEIKRKAITVQTFDKRQGKWCRWANNGDGTFRLIYPHTEKNITCPIEQLYYRIKYAVHDNRIIALREKIEDSLKSVNITIS